MVDSIVEYIRIDKDGVKLHQEVAGTAQEPKEVSLEQFFQEFSNYASIDTGILPLDGSGTLAIRSALGFTQTAYQHAPGIYPVNWGQYEGDDMAQTYWLAQPWRIVISDYKDNKLLGSKTFYSMSPILHGNEQLYHVNVPNTNCLGYGDGNGLGWLCLYHNTKDYTHSFRGKFDNAIERSSGVETYNDSNMSETDGTRFYLHEYQRNHPTNYNDYAYLWDPDSWAKKSETEGFEWTLDPRLWIPVLCDDLDKQANHVPDGVPLTFNRTLYGHYAAYYYDIINERYESKTGLGRSHPIKKPFNIISRKNTPLDEATVFTHLKASVMAKGNTLFGNFDQFDFTNGDPFPDPSDALIKCNDCKGEFEFSDMSADNSLKIKVCKDCYDKEYSSCVHCELTFAKTDLESFGHLSDLCYRCLPLYDNCNSCEAVFETSNMHKLKGEWECYACTPVYTCKSCDIDHLSSDEVFDTEIHPFCIECGVPGVCSLCAKVNDLTQMTILQKGTDYLISSFSDADEYNMCEPCNATVKICSCKSLHPVGVVVDQAGLPGTTECPSCKVTQTYSLLDLLV